jgi:hypothetical protein
MGGLLGGIGGAVFSKRRDNQEQEWDRRMRYLTERDSA